SHPRISGPGRKSGCDCWAPPNAAVDMERPLGEQHEVRRAHRWGKEKGYCVVDGQKVPIRRTRFVFDGQCRFQEIDCERSCCRVGYESRESLTFNDDSGNLVWCDANGY